MEPGLIVLFLFLVFAVIVVLRTVRIVPQQTSLIIERLGRYSRTLEGGIRRFHEICAEQMDLAESSSRA